MSLKLYLGLALLLLIVIFAVQNAEVVSIKFLIWEASLSRAIMIFLVLCTGILLGWVLGAAARHSRD